VYQDIELLISQYLNNHHASLAKQFDEEVLGQARDDLRLWEIEEVEHAILGTSCPPLNVYTG